MIKKCPKCGAMMIPQKEYNYNQFTDRDEEYYFWNCQACGFDDQVFTDEEEQQLVLEKKEAKYEGQI